MACMSQDGPTTASTGLSLGTRKVSRVWLVVSPIACTRNCKEAFRPGLYNFLNKFFYETELLLIVGYFYFSHSYDGFEHFLDD